MKISNGNKLLPPPEEMEKAYLESDESYDGIFYLGVVSTGIFCRPSCGARKPLPKNVKYFSSQKEALFDGFRPCKRCKPMETQGKLPDWAEGLLKRIEENPTARYSDFFLRSINIDPAKARRFFVKNFGMTFQAYCRGRRLGISFEQIRMGKNLDDVALGYGYESHSGFRDAFTKTFGKAPGKSRNSEYIVASWIESPMGPLVAAANRDGICLLEFSDRRMINVQFGKLRKYFKCAIVPGENEHIKLLKTELKKYFEGKLKSFNVKILYPGTPFQVKVWKELLNIKFGKTMSYSELAKRVGTPNAQRAVGTANGFNRIAIVIPCHRIVNKNGKLGGYGGGIWRKQKLLQLESENS